MSAYENFNDYKAKMDELCTKQLLVCNFNADRYPIVLTITPDKDPSAQMVMFSIDEGVSSADAAMEYRFNLDSIDVKINGRLCLTDEVMNKFKTLAKKMVDAYVFGYFVEQKQREALDARFNYPKADSGDFEGFFEDEETEDGAEE